VLGRDEEEDEDRDDDDEDEDVEDEDEELLDESGVAGGRSSSFQVPTKVPAYRICGRVPSRVGSNASDVTGQGGNARFAPPPKPVTSRQVTPPSSVRYTWPCAPVSVPSPPVPIAT
jgi:hypothetical protein